MERSQRSIRIGIIILTLFHLVGMLGLVWEPSRPLFQRLVPLDLLLSASVLAYFHYPMNSKWIWFFVLIFSLGWGVEILGVQTGWPFGAYGYGTALGPKIWDTPPLIGLNWLLLVYAAGMISIKFPLGRIGRALLGAVLMTCLDLLIEPVAVQLNFWQWESASIPIQNYFSWFFIASAFLYYFHRLPIRSINPLAYPFFIIQLVFFALLGLFL